MLQLLCTLFVLLLTLIGIRYRRYFISSVLLINVVMDGVTLYGSDFFVSPGYMRLLSMSALIWSQRKAITLEPIFRSIVSYFILVVVIGLVNSSNKLVVIEGGLKLVLPMLFFPATKVLSEENYKETGRSLAMTLLACSFTILVFLFFAQVFKLGESPYIENFFFLGGFNIQITYFMAYAVIMLLFLSSLPRLLSYRHKVLVYCVVGVLCVCICLIFRRAAIVSILFTFGSFVLLRKGRWLQILPLCLVLWAGGVFVKNQFPFLSEVVEKRQSNELHDEGRFMEFETVVEDLNYSGSAYWFFGRELFNSRQYFEGTSSVRMRNQTQLHTDVATLLHGSGIFGLVAYLYVIIVLFRMPWRVLQRGELLFPLVPIVVAYILFSLSGQYYIMSAWAILSVSLGWLSSQEQRS